MSVDPRRLMQAQRAAQMPGAPKPKGEIQQPRTVQTRNFKGMNLTDARVAIGDDELYWAENAITVGAGAIQILPVQGDSIATIAAGIVSMWGFDLTIATVSTPVLITINSDGSGDQIELDGTVTNMGGAGTFDTDAALTIWRDSPILIVGPTKGYMSWDGASLTVIDATKDNRAIAVFEGRVWLALNRTITFTAPNTNNDFTAGNGAGSTIITDEAFPGNIVTMISAFEQLWVFGQGAVEAISNVQSSGGGGSVVTTFSVTNIVAGLGTASRASVNGYFRALTFMAPFGVYALSGVTPQKLSDKLDGMFQGLTLGDCPSAVFVVQNLQALVYLVTYTQADAPQLPKPASDVTTATPLLLCFTQGKWFVASQGDLTWITSVLVNGTPQGWGTDGSDVFRIFGGDTDDDVTSKLVSKLYDFGLATTEKAETKFGLEFQASAGIGEITATLDNETSSTSVALNTGNVLRLVNSLGEELVLRNNVNAILTLIATGMVLSRAVANMYGRYLGWTLTTLGAPFRVQAVQNEVILTREWQT